MNNSKGKITRYASGLLTLVLLLSLMPMGGTPVHAANPGDVVINEIMQNPSAVGDSAGEWFELFNPTGGEVDINGWTIADNDIDSHVIDNGGPLVIPAGGYLVLGNNTDSATNGGVDIAYSYGASWFLANGADEVVLLDNSLTEIDRVEYDGGLTFPDPNGASMSLIDPALDNNIGDNWCTASTLYGDGDLGTPGVANDCVVTMPELVVNEIMQNPSAVSDSAGEWFELYNPTGDDVDIEGWTIQDNDFDSHVIDNGGPLVIPAGGYLVLGNNAEFATNGGVNVDYVFSSIFLGNSGDELVLLDGALNEIDRVEWDDGATFPDPNGASMALVNSALDNNVGGNWCTAATPYGDGDLGTPGAANDCPPPEIVINEIMQNPSAVLDSVGEWFELFNPTGGEIDINGWTIADNDTDSHVIDNGGPLIIPAGGYLVLGNNTDSATNGGVDIAYSYGTQWFLANGADEVVLLDSSLAEIDRVEYDGGPTFPDPNGASMVLAGPALDNNVGANWCTAETPFGAGDLGTPGVVNDCNECGDPFTHVYEVQGSGGFSPLDEWPVSVEGVVIGDFQGSDELQGFFMQDLDGDGEPGTSDGIFVYSTIDVSVGDAVRVIGEVDEYYDLTEITNVAAVLICGEGSVAPTEVDLPVVDLGDWEQYEGMLINIPQTLYVTGNYTQGRYGEVDLSVGDRLDQPTNVVLPGEDAIALQDLNDRSRIQLDDGSTVQNPLPLPPYLGPDNTLRAGDTIPGLTGVLGFSFENYEVHPTEPVDFARVNGRTATPDDVGGVIKIASFNVLNYFSTIDDSGPICGPTGGMDCRGADTAEEFVRQRTKIIAAIVTVDADVIGLMELENHPTDDALQDLVDGLNAATAAGTYAFIDTGPVGTDAIKVAFIYKPGTVTPVGAAVILDSSVDPNFNSDYNRPAIAQTFERSTGGGRFTAVVNHLKSKGSPCDAIGDPDTGDGQGNCNLTRKVAAIALTNWLAGDPTGSGDPDFFIIGDLNSYAMEDPITAIKNAGYANLIETSLGLGAYSYVFEGQAGYLDHALASLSAVSQVSETTVWHINADEPVALDYNNYNQPALYSPDAYSSSDHDPVIVGFCDAVPPEVSISVTPDLLWPPNHKYATVEATVGVTDNIDPNPVLELVSVTSNEPDNGEDDGDTINDIVIVDDFTFKLRAERSGIGTGRIYTITYQATDACGNSTEASATVTVPLSLGED